MKIRNLVTLLLVLGCLLCSVCGVGLADNRLVIATGHQIPNTILNAFAEKYPELELEVLLYPSWEFDEKLLMLFLTGQRIDAVFEWSVYEWTNYAINGQLLDLTPFVERDRQWLEEVGVHPLAYESGYVGDRLAGINIELRMGWSIFYNDQLLQAAGLPRPPARWDTTDWDWETFENYVQKLAVWDAGGNPIQHGFGHFDDDLVIFNLAWMWGTDVLPAEAYETGVVERVRVSQPEMISAFEALFRAEERGANTANKNYFLEGRAAMWLGVGDFRDYDFPWGVTRAPVGVTGPIPMATWSSFVGIPFTAGNPDGAWEFIKFMLSDGNLLRDDQGQWWRSGISVQTWEERFETAQNSVLSRAELLEFYITGLDSYTRISPRTIIHGAGLIRDPIWNEMRVNTGINKANLSVSEALQNAEIRINTALYDLHY